MSKSIVWKDTTLHKDGTPSHDMHTPFGVLYSLYGFTDTEDLVSESRTKVLSGETSKFQVEAFPDEFGGISSIEGQRFNDLESAKAACESDYMRRIEIVAEKQK